MAVIVLNGHSDKGPNTNILHCLSSPVYVSIEQAGRGYQNQCFPRAVTAKATTAPDAEDADKADEDEALRVKLSSTELDLEDYYVLLGLEKDNVFASEKQIKQSWKIISRVCHPDKATPETRDFAELRYKAQQKAFATLSVNDSRRGYDSMLPFDEKIPKDNKGKGSNFFSVYGPVFERNARFSEIRPVPLLGDEKTDYETVDRFYDFWLLFKSWRDFKYLDEHHPDDMTDRFEKREMERKNKKLRAGKKKEDVLRVRKLTEDAMKKDPRMLAEKKRVADAKDFAKSEKKRLAQEKIDNAAKEKADAENAAAEKAKQEIKDRKFLKEMKNQQKKIRNKLRKVAFSNRAGMQDEDEVELLCAGLEIKELAELCKLFGATGDLEEPLPDDEKATALAMFAQRLSEIKNKEQEEKAAKQKASDEAKAQKEAEAKALLWSKEEEEQLQKAIRKFKGKYEVWEKVLVMVQEINPRRTLKEVIKRAKS